MDIISTPSWAGACVPPSNSTLMTAFSGKVPATCVEIKFYGAFVLNRRVLLQHLHDEDDRDDRKEDSVDVDVGKRWRRILVAGRSLSFRVTEP